MFWQLLWKIENEKKSQMFKCLLFHIMKHISMLLSKIDEDTFIYLLWFKSLKLSTLFQVASLCNPLDCSLSSSSVHGIFHLRVLEWVTISFSELLWLIGYLEICYSYSFLITWNFIDIICLLISNLIPLWSGYIFQLFQSFTFIET